MIRQALKTILKEAIIELMATDAGKAAFGPVVFNALGQWLNSYEIELEKHHPGGAVEVVKERGDILAHIAHWIQNSEGAIRGAQADAAAARNRATETRDIMEAIAVGRSGQNKIAAPVCRSIT